MWISHIEIYSKKFRVGYRTSFPVIQLHVSRAFTADTNDYSLVTSLMRNKDAHKSARDITCITDTLVNYTKRKKTKLYQPHFQICSNNLHKSACR